MRTCLLQLLFPFVLMAQPGNPSSLSQVLAAPAQFQTETQTPSTTQPQEEAEEKFRLSAEQGVKHMLVSQVEAWNHRQLERFMQGYWNSPDLIFFSGGTVTKGWEPTLQRYRQRYQSQGKEMGELAFQDLNIDVVSRRAAVVTGSFQLTMPDGTKPHGLFTLIVKKMPGGWKIVHDHTSSAE